jgi:hypothetical protein
MFQINRRGLALALLSACLCASNAFAAKLPEGTEVSLRMVDKVTSASATEGQRFSLELDQDIAVNGVVMVPRGAKAVGTVVNARKRGHMGKAGELNVLVNYLIVGEQHVPLRASAGREGDSKIGATVALTVLFGPIGLLKRGKDVELNPGTIVAAQVDQTTELPESAPLAAGAR